MRSYFVGLSNSERSTPSLDLLGSWLSSSHSVLNSLLCRRRNYPNQQESLVTFLRQRDIVTSLPAVVADLLLGRCQKHRRRLLDDLFISWNERNNSLRRPLSFPQDVAVPLLLRRNEHSLHFVAGKLLDCRRLDLDQPLVVS